MRRRSALEPCSITAIGKARSPPVIKLLLRSFRSDKHPVRDPLLRRSFQLCLQSLLADARLLFSVELRPMNVEGFSSQQLHQSGRLLNGAQFGGRTDLACGQHSGRRPGWTPQTRSTVDVLQNLKWDAVQALHVE